MRTTLTFLTFAAAFVLPASAQTSNVAAEIERRAKAVESKVVAWRRDIHQNPELGNQEVRTSKLVAEHLRALGIEVRTNVATTGVVGVLKGGKPGPVIALRADMDALPVTELVNLPFASKVRTTYEGREVGVMHACGHDTHVAMLMGVAEILAGMRAQLPGTVKFIFQPAEEGVDRAEEPAGAELMIREGVLKNPDVDAVFGMHVFANVASGAIGWRSGPMLAANDSYEITVRGRQTHGANPWAGVDPIVIGSQIVMALQTIVSRQINIAQEPAIITVGQFDAGTRSNIIPDTARLVGTIRTFDEAMRKDIHARMTRTAESIAAAAGGSATVRIDQGYPVTVNNPELTRQMMPTLQRVAGARLTEVTKNTVAEDFSKFQQAVPGLFLFLGITPPQQVGSAPANHSPEFFVDESALVTGVRVMTNLAVDYLFNSR